MAVTRSSVIWLEFLYYVFIFVFIVKNFNFLPGLGIRRHRFRLHDGHLFGRQRAFLQTAIDAQLRPRSRIARHLDAAADRRELGSDEHEVDRMARSVDETQPNRTDTVWFALRIVSVHLYNRTEGARHFTAGERHLRSFIGRRK